MQEASIKKALVVLIIGGCLLWAGCTEPNPLYRPGADLPDECRDGVEVSEAFEAFERPDRVDLWFVVSNSEGMPEYQQALASAVRPFLTRLEDDEFDVRAAVSTMDATVSPGLAPAGTIGDDCAGNSRQVARSGQSGWIDTVQCNLQQGIDGDRRQRPFDATYQALVEEPESLEDFRRDDARLVIVMLTNEDDCSGSNFSDDTNHRARDLCAWQSDDLRDVEGWVEDMRDSAQVPEGISLAVISGPPVQVVYEDGENVRHVCSSSLGSGYPSPRFAEAVRKFGNQGLFLSSCVFDFYDHLEIIGNDLARRETVTLCPTEPMAHEPLSVQAVSEDGDAEDIPFGNEGFTFRGSTDECPDGAIEVRRHGLDDVRRVEMHYCAL